MAAIKLKGDTSGEVTIQAPAVAGTTTLNLPATSSTLATQNALGVRNLIINGDMRIAQRGTSSTGITAVGYYTIDRWNVSMGTAGTWTMSQDTDVPSGQGFANSMKFACTTANASLSAGSYFNITQRFEGQNLQHLKKGTASAETLTASFWIKSNKTGTYIVETQDIDNLRIVSKSFTISSADTWENKTITIEGDTTGALNNDNGQSLNWKIWLVAGTTFSSGTLATSWEAQTNANRAVGVVNLADSTSNYINITGVQLEVGDTATPFEHRPYDMELARCQRYYYVPVNGVNHEINVGWYYNNNWLSSIIDLPVPMRVKPSMTVTSGTGYYIIYRNNSSDALNSFVLENTNTNHTCVSIYNNTDVSGTAGQAGILRAVNASAKIQLSSEL